MIFDKNYITSALLPRIRGLWLSSQDTFPDFLLPVSLEEKRNNEAWVTAAMERLQRHMKAFPSRSRIAVAALLQEAAGAGRLFPVPFSPAAEMDTGNGIAVSRAPV